MVASILVLPTKGGSLTRRSILEYADAVRDRYLRSKRVAKTKILDEFVAATGLHRKATVRLLNRVGKKGSRKKSGRPKLYSLETISALKVAWEASDRLCSKRFQPFLPELVGILKREGELSITEDTESQLSRMSASTIDRVLRRWRAKAQRHGLSTTRPGTLLKNAIPLKTFSEWSESQPGCLEVDLVAHCGDSVEGFYSTRCQRSMWQRAGTSRWRSGAKGRIVLVARSMMCGSGFQCLYQGFTRITAVSSSIRVCTSIAGGRASTLPAPAPTRRTIAATWSKRIGR